MRVYLILYYVLEGSCVVVLFVVFDLLLFFFGFLFFIGIVFCFWLLDLLEDFFGVKVLCRFLNEIVVEFLCFGCCCEIFGFYLVM